MGIDQIGKKAPPLPTAGEASPAGTPQGTFEVGQPGAAESPSSVAAVSPSLQQFRAGAIDLNAYLDIKVREATAHLGQLAAPQLEAIRSALRDRLTTDPTLVDLVQRATGAIPSPTED